MGRPQPPPYFPNFTSTTHKKLLAETPWEEDSILLQLEMRENEYTFRYGAAEGKLTELAKASGAVINPEKVGCMVGEMLGVFASGNGTPSSNSALFDWVEVLSSEN